MGEIKDITGQRFGRLVAIKHIGFNKWGNAWWLCQCDCGRERIIVGGSLAHGTISCGCVKRGRGNSRYRHGHARPQSPYYRIWNQMHQRCYNANNPAYKNYGGRGIKVCKRWHDFINFLADVGKRPPGRSLDRVNNDGDYSSNNFRWATPKEQRDNQGLKRIDQFTTAELKAELKRRIHLKRVRAL